MFGISELKVWFLLSLVQKLLEIRLISDKTQSLQGPIVVKINYNSGTGVKISFFTISVGTNTNKYSFFKIDYKWIRLLCSVLQLQS